VLIERRLRLTRPQTTDRWKLKVTVSHLLIDEPSQQVQSIFGGGGPLPIAMATETTGVRQ